MRSNTTILATILALSSAILGSSCSDSRPVSSESVAPPENDETAETGAHPTRPARIILFSMDTVRADRIGGYRGFSSDPNHGRDGRAERDPSPNLSQIAKEGVLFRNFFAASSFTLPATMSIFTGLDPIEHGIWHEAAVLSPDVSTLAETLRESGYRTQGFHEDGYVNAKFGFSRGFDVYKSHPQKKVVEESLWLILDWMRNAKEPYFLFLHTYAAHDPYGGLERYRAQNPDRGLPSDAEIAELRQRYPRRPAGIPHDTSAVPTQTREMCTLVNQLVSSGVERLACGYKWLHPDFPKTPNFESDRAALLAGYDDRIRKIDRAIGKIRDLLIELDQWEDTLLIVTADHGEAFFEHGMYRHDHVPFNEVLKVPLIISYPKLLRETATRVVDGLAWHLDLKPTILALSGATDSETTRGVDLTGVMLGETEIASDRSIFPGVLRIPHEGPAPIRRVVLSGDLKYIEGHAYFGDPDGFLFDLSDSPDETTNLREKRPDEFESLADKARGYARELVIHPAIDRETNLPITAAPGEIDAVARLLPEEEEALRALGYRD